MSCRVGETNPENPFFFARAPEILSREGHGKVVDWWSLGALLFDMLTGTPPFSANNRKKTMEKILKAQVRFPQYMTDEAKLLLGRLLKRNPAQRLGVNGADEIKNHIFFRKICWDSVLAKELKPPFIPQCVRRGRARAGMCILGRSPRVVCRRTSWT